MEGSSMDYTTETPSTAVTLGLDDMSDRELLLFNARKTQAILDVLQSIHDTLGPALEKMGPVMAMLGLG